MSWHDAEVVGAFYGALQGVAQLIMLVVPKNTILWAIAKFVVSGPSRVSPEA